MIHSNVRNNKADPEFQMYFKYYEPAHKIPPHRILAINRGEKKGILKINIDIDHEKIYKIITDEYIKNMSSIFYDLLIITIKDSYNIYTLVPSSSKNDLEYHIGKRNDI